MLPANALSIYEEAISHNVCYDNSSAPIILAEERLETQSTSENSKQLGTAVMGESNNFKLTSNLSKSEMLELLTRNILPPYKPPPFPTALHRNSLCETYSCSSCGSMFVLKSSLAFHINRRSMLIRFSCDSCPSEQVFYNNCSLKNHICAHRDKAEPSDISKALVLPLPYALMEGVTKDILQNLEENDGDNDHPSSPGAEAPTPAALLEVTISEGENKIELNTPFEIPQGKDKKLIQCSECSAEFINAAERQNHFTNKEKLPTVLSPCSKCGIICPSGCSAKAHKRLHLQISPYVCPECGDNPDRYWDNFQRHLTYQCFHYARSLCYKCPLCQTLVTSLQLLKQHSVSNHTDILYKCQMCPMAFTNFTNFQIHKKKIHASELLTGCLSDCLQMYQCCMCHVVFISKDDSDNHWDVHLTENICQYAYTCSECNRVLESKLKLRDHLKQFHIELFNKHIAFLNFPHEVSASKGNVRDIGLSKLRLECLLCHGAFMTRQGHSLHVTKSHSNHKYPCGVCNRTSVNRLEMISHGKEHLRENISLCLLCQNKPMKPPDSLDLHLLNHVERVKYQTFCPICETAMFTFTEALQHLRMEHLLPTTNGPMNFYNSAATEQKAEKEKFTSNIKTLPSGEKRSSANVSLSAYISGLSYEERVRKGIAAAPPRKNGEKWCVKCDFTSIDKSEFKQHILTHKEKKSTHQCQECGLCFVVEPPLKMHLKIAHKILQPDQYLAEMGANYIPENEAVQEMVKSNDLECSVCFEVFASEALLKTHMRSHGMAFIQAKKLSSLNLK